MTAQTQYYDCNLSHQAVFNFFPLKFADQMTRDEIHAIVHLDWLPHFARPIIVHVVCTRYTLATRFHQARWQLCDYGLLSCIYSQLFYSPSWLGLYQGGAAYTVKFHVDETKSQHRQLCDTPGQPLHNYAIMLNEGYTPKTMVLLLARTWDDVRTQDCQHSKAAS